MRSRIRLFILLAIGLIGTTSCARVPKTARMPIAQAGAPSLYWSQQFASPHNIYHTVGPSETLWRISKTYGVDMKTLMAANRLNDPKKIKNGQQLLIPHTLGPRPVIPLYPGKRWTHIVIHHTATDNGDAFSIDKLHHKRGFWNGLGYHFLINNGTNGKVDGQIQVGPRWVKQQDGAHANAAGMNEKGIGIALVGNYSEKYVSSAEFESLMFLVKALQKHYRIPNRNVVAHREIPGKNTECPGTNFPWAELKRRLSV